MKRIFVILVFLLSSIALNAQVSGSDLTRNVNGKAGYIIKNTSVGANAESGFWAVFNGDTVQFIISDIDATTQAVIESSTTLIIKADTVWFSDGTKMTTALWINSGVSESESLMQKVVVQDIDILGNVYFANSSSLESDDFNPRGIWTYTNLYTTQNIEFYGGTTDSSKIRAAILASDIVKFIDSYLSISGNLSCSATGYNTLDFSDGGDLIGFDGTITGDSTKIINPDNHQIFADDAVFAGTFDCEDIKPEWFGAKGDGATGDQLALNTCFNFGRLNSSDVVELRSNAIYWIEGNQSLNVANLIINGNNAIIHPDTLTDTNYWIFQANGAAGTQYDIDSTVLYNSNFIVSSALKTAFPNLKEGDILQITSSEYYETSLYVSPSYPGTYMSELVEISSIRGDVFIISGYLKNTYHWYYPGYFSGISAYDNGVNYSLFDTVTYLSHYYRVISETPAAGYNPTTAYWKKLGSYVSKPTMATCQIRDLIVEKDTMLLSYFPIDNGGFYSSYGKDIVLDNFHTRNIGLTALEFLDIYRCTINNSSVINSGSNGYGYGIYVGQTCTKFDFGNSRIEGVKHATDMGGFGTGLPEDIYYHDSYVSTSNLLEMSAVINHHSCGSVKYENMTIVSGVQYRKDPLFNIPLFRDVVNYALGDTVNYRQYYYKAILDPAIGVQPTNGTYWSLITPYNFNVLTDYNLGDTVLYGNSYWKAIKDPPAGYYPIYYYIAPLDYWKVIPVMYNGGDFLPELYSDDSTYKVGRTVIYNDRYWLTNTNPPMGTKPDDDYYWTYLNGVLAEVNAHPVAINLSVGAKSVEIINCKVEGSYMTFYSAPTSNIRINSLKIKGLDGINCNGGVTISGTGNEIIDNLYIDGISVKNDYHSQQYGTLGIGSKVTVNNSYFNNISGENCAGIDFAHISSPIHISNVNFKYDNNKSSGYTTGVIGMTSYADSIIVDNISITGHHRALIAGTPSYVVMNNVDADVYCYGANLTSTAMSLFKISGQLRFYNQAITNTVLYNHSGNITTLDYDLRLNADYNNTIWLADNTGYTLTNFYSHNTTGNRTLDFKVDPVNEYIATPNGTGIIGNNVLIDGNLSTEDISVTGYYEPTGLNHFNNGTCDTVADGGMRYWKTSINFIYGNTWSYHYQKILFDTYPYPDAGDSVSQPLDSLAISVKANTMYRLTYSVQNPNTHTITFQLTTGIASVAQNLDIGSAVESTKTLDFMTNNSPTDFTIKRSGGTGFCVIYFDNFTLYELRPVGDVSIFGRVTGINGIDGMSINSTGNAEFDRDVTIDSNLYVNDSLFVDIVGDNLEVEGTIKSNSKTLGGTDSLAIWDGNELKYRLPNFGSNVSFSGDLDYLGGENGTLGTGRSLNLEGYLSNPYFSFGAYQNHLKYTEVFSDATWTKTALSGTVTSNSATCPYGDALAEIIPAGTDATGSVKQAVTTTNTTGYWTASVWAKVNDGAGVVTLKLTTNTETGLATKSYTLTDRWQRIYITNNLASAYTTKTFEIINGTEAISLFGAMLDPVAYIRPYNTANTTALTTTDTRFFRINAGALTSASTMSIISLGVGAIVESGIFYQRCGNSLAATSNDGFLIQNQAAATSGIPVQMPPRVRFEGTAWNTTPTAASNTINIYNEMLPISGASTSADLLWKYSNSSVGGGSYSTIMTLGSTGNLTVTGGLTSDNDYGELYDPVDVISTASATTYYTLTGWTSGDLNDATYTTDSLLVVSEAGTYLINWSLSLTHATVSTIVHICVFKNNTTELTDMETEQKMGTGGDLLNIGGTGMVALAGGDKISLRVKGSNAGNLTINHGNLNLIRIK